MHDARHAPAGRRLEGEHRPAAALGDEVVLKVLGERRIAGDLAQPLGQLAAALAQLATQAAQHRRSRVLRGRSRPPRPIGRSPPRPRAVRRRCSAVSSCSAGRSSRAVSARRPAAPARIVRSTSERLLVSSVLPRAARSAASVTSATPPRSGSAASSSSATASVVCCWRRRTSSASADGRRPSARSAPGSLAAAAASRASTAGSSSSSRSCSRMRRVYGGFARCTAIRRVIRFAACGTASRCHS